jgi:hypothetical protein
VLVLLLTALGTTFAAADSIEFIYNGPGGPDATATGFGFITFNHGLKTLSLSNLTAFQFVQTTVFDISGITVTFFYTTNDLIDFSATLAGPRLTSLSLDTVATPGTIFSAPEAFHVTSLFDLDGAYTTGNVGIVLTQGSVTLIPEPGTLGLMGTGLIGILALVRKRLRI